MTSSNPAAEFLSTILFIDDEATKGAENHGNSYFDFNKFADDFTREGKLCTLFSPEKCDDLNICLKLADKADVTILDWFINFPIPDDVDNTEDADSDVRGKFAIDFLISILKKCRNQLKLFLVYTNESIESVFNDAYTKLRKVEDIRKDDSDDYLLSFKSIKIYFRKKNISDEPDGKSSKGLLNPEQVPSFISSKFASMNNGLLPEFALKCASSIKENTFEILNLFSSDMDYAYLDHKSCISDTDSSISILFNLYSSVLKELLSSQVNDFSLLEEKWVKFYISKIDEGCSIKRDIKCVLGLESYPTKEEYEKKVDSAGKKHFVGKQMLTDEAKLIDAFVKFAKLTHLCVDFSINEDKSHILSLGTIVCDEEHNFYFCIQQRCDSVRINGKRRKFLFLPLIEKKIENINSNGKKISIILDKDMAFEIKNHSFDIHTIFFESDVGCVESEYINGDYVFSDCEGKKYKYLGRVNEMHALRIARAYGEKLSRIGLDDFEWFRRLGSK